MTNAERRAALNLARKKCLEHALASDRNPLTGGYQPGQSVCQQHAELAKMWAGVAEAMKDGDPIHDAPDGRPINNVIDGEYGTLTR